MAFCHCPFCTERPLSEGIAYCPEGQVWLIYFNHEYKGFESDQRHAETWLLGLRSRWPMLAA